MALNHKRLIGFTLCFSGLIVLGTPPVYGGEDAVFKEAKKTETHLRAQNKKEVSPRKKKSPLAAILDQISDFLIRVPKPAATRGSVCAIAPGILEQKNRVYTQQPLFIWNGTVDEVQIEDYYTRKILWSEAVPVGSQLLKYSGTHLQAGETYVWALKYKGVSKARGVIEIMNSTERTKILNENNSKFGKATASEYFAKANYFAEQELWSDYLTSLATDVSFIPKNSADNLMQSWPNQHCQGETG